MIDNTNGFSIEHKIQSNSHLQCPIWKTLKKEKKKTLTTTLVSSGEIQWAPFREMQMSGNIKPRPIKNVCDYAAIKARKMNSINLMFN